MKDGKLIKLKDQLLDADESRWESILKRAGLKTGGRDSLCWTPYASSGHGLMK
jgi:hypothetical protein